MRNSAFVSLAMLGFGLFYSSGLLSQNKFLETTFEASGFGQNQHASPGLNGWVMPQSHWDCLPDYMVLTSKQSGTYKKIAMPDYDMIGNCIQTDKNEFICSGLFGKGADVLSYVKAVVLKTDTAGKIAWEVKFSASEIPGVNFPGAITKTVLSDDGSIYGISPGKFICKIEGNGTKSWAKAYPEINDILWTTNGLVGSGMNHIYQLDTGGNITKDNNFPGDHLFSWMQHGNSGKIFSSNDKGEVFTIDSNWSIVDSFRFPGFSNYAKKLTALTYCSDSGFYFAEFDSIASYSIKGVFNWKRGFPQDASITGIDFDGEQIAVTGNQRLPFIKTLDQKGNTSPINRDVSITGINLVHISSDRIPYQADYMINADFDVIIKNNGNEIIDSLYLHSDGPLNGLAYLCNDNVLKAYHNLGLLPGNSMPIRFRVHRFLANFLRSDTVNLNIDVYAESPNGKLDNNLSDNAINYTKTITGIDPYSSEQYGFTVYPNPVSTFLIVTQKSEEAVEISLISATGQKIRNIRNNSVTNQIDMSDLPKGIYLISIQNENGTYLKKVLKN